MNPEVTASYEYAATAVARSHSNFARAFSSLSRSQRLAFYAVYAFMRFCDDVSDSDDTVAAKRAGLNRWRALLDGTLAVEANMPAARIMPAFRDTLQRFAIPTRYFHWIIDGTAMDLENSCYETFADLYNYCFHVASAVGLVCLRIFGVPEIHKERAEKLAEQCGIAFQLTNILRDIKEDADRGRIYLPLEDLRQFGYAEADLRRGVINENFRRLMAFETDRANYYYTQARALLPLVNSGSRTSLWTMIEVYRRLLDHIIDKRYDVFSQRIRLSLAEKLVVVSRSLLMRWRP